MAIGHGFNYCQIPLGVSVSLRSEIHIGRAAHCASQNGPIWSYFGCEIVNRSLTYLRRPKIREGSSVAFSSSSSYSLLFTSWLNVFPASLAWVCEGEREGWCRMLHHSSASSLAQMSSAHKLDSTVVNFHIQGERQTEGRPLTFTWLKDNFTWLMIILGGVCLHLALKTTWTVIETESFDNPLLAAEPRFEEKC